MTSKKFKSTEYHFTVDYPNKYVSLGIDPGTVHLGIAFVFPHFHTAYAFEIEKERENLIETRIVTMLYMISFFSAWTDLSHLTVEGASYMDRYRQVEMEDIRAACVCWKQLHGSSAIFEAPPPLTIRKTVFGSGKIKNPWAEQGLPDNAAAALGCALYPIFKDDENESNNNV